MHYFVDSVIKILSNSNCQRRPCGKRLGAGTQSALELMKLQSGFAGISLKPSKE